MKRALPLLFAATLSLFGCGGARLSHDEIRRQIAELGTSTLIPKDISVRRVVSESGNRMIAETTVELAVQFERDTANSPWHPAALRLGDRNWLSIAELMTILNESRRKEAVTSLRKLDAGVVAYRQRNGSAPTASDIKTMADALHPQYMSDLVLDDPWGHPILVESANSVFRFRSLGPDGQRGTADDVLFPE